MSRISTYTYETEEEHGQETWSHAVTMAAVKLQEEEVFEEQFLEAEDADGNLKNLTIGVEGTNARRRDYSGQVHFESPQCRRSETEIKISLGYDGAKRGILPHDGIFGKVEQAMDSGIERYS